MRGHLWGDESMFTFTRGCADFRDPIAVFRLKGLVKIPACLTDPTTILLQATEARWVSARKFKMFVWVSLAMPQGFIILNFHGIHKMHVCTILFLQNVVESTNSYV